MKNVGILSEYFYCIFYLLQTMCVTQHTGWSMSFLYTLTGLYDNNICTKKIVVGINSKPNNFKF